MGSFPLGFASWLGRGELEREVGEGLEGVGEGLRKASLSFLQKSGLKDPNCVP